MTMSSSACAHQRASASVGRVGGLAVALGVGAAVATGLAAPASADSTGAADAATSVSARTSNSHRNHTATPPVTSRTKAVVASAAAVRHPARRAAAHGIQTPSAPVAASTAVNLLAAAGRELGRTFLNQYPTTAPSITTQSADGVVTGSLGAADPEGDRLVYTVVGKPSLGRVSIDQSTGDFTYTPVVDVASYGGTDAFTVSISDETNVHIHGLQGLLDAPIRLLRAIPFVGSLLSDYLPSTNTTATVKLTFDGSGTVAALAFPEGFHWGVSTAGFQSEMGGGAPLDVNSDWWQWTHDPFNKLLLGWKGAVPEDGPGAYTQYVTDAQLAREGVGADTFRMSIEWSRIFPNSTEAVDNSNGVTPEVLAQLDALANADEVAHYRDQLAAMHAAGLDPMVTINHFTLPLWVHDPAQARIEEFFGQTPQIGGGWVSTSTVTEFEKYAAYLAWKYGDQVTNWVVLNEPVNSMLTSYYAIPFATNFPPAIVRTDLVAVGLRNEAAAYSASYDIIHQLDPDAQVGFALNMYTWRGGDPANPSDQQAAAEFSDFYNRWFPDAVLRGEVDANFDGVITPDEIHPELAGKADYFGVNYYSQGIVIGYGGLSVPGLPVVKGYPEFSPLINVVIGGCLPATECSDTAQIINPAGLRDVLDIADSYGIPLWVTESGLADAADTKRASYTVRHLAVINKAIADGMDIRGYTAWSLTDNLEWVLGYDPRYGLYSYDPVTLVRTPRPSVSLIHDIFAGNAISADVFRTYVKDVRS
ncbi:family 1 glycosylhydrolase [Mycolicibacterium sp.]|uniref:family 1 glycosylhydrolase n=1 Tax=Mycolicibacterium sp. TaxID=2320850 RepID=UPI001A2D3A9B|nr:family 1 glycosylhydrolase [Mycolicibacterium sp.]MBJ7400028.1 family 1 glycosylhydrolase [Mycolicibacterium sp.]